MFKLGEAYFIRTITFHYIGIVDNVSAEFVSLSNASWVADSGRFYNALYTGTLNEVEPYPYGVSISIAAIVDVSPWKHQCPTEPK